MKVLIIMDDVWNDIISGNNILTNWFTGFDGEFAQIFTNPSLPHNNICKKYFQINDSDIAKSIFTCHRAGRILSQTESSSTLKGSETNVERTGCYLFFKKISLYFHTLVSMFRDLLWKLGKINEAELKTFIDAFEPDVVFCPHYANYKILRIENIVSNLVDVPFIAFTGDDELSLCRKTSFLERIQLSYVRKMFLSNTRFYSHYCTFSEDQCLAYQKQFNIPSTVLYKCITASPFEKCKPVNKPIRLVYAGRVYCNRWKTLLAIGQALNVLNSKDLNMILEVYTQDVLSSKVKKSLEACKYIYLKDPVSPDELSIIYSRSDIALHVESLDETYRVETQWSFSTKIIDLMNSTCAILAICWEQHTGLKYLKQNDAAICIDDYSEILPTLETILADPGLLKYYRERAYNCGIKNHSQDVIHSEINRLFANYSRR